MIGKGRARQRFLLHPRSIFFIINAQRTVYRQDELKKIRIFRKHHHPRLSYSLNPIDFLRLDRIPPSQYQQHVQGDANFS